MPDPATPASPTLRAFRSATVALALLALCVAVPGPARAESQLAEAARDLSSGEHVHVAEGGPEVSEQTLALARARLSEARTPIRGALLEGVDPARAVHTLAEEVGEPGLYVVATEERAATGGVTTSLSWTAVGIDTGGADLEDHFVFSRGGPVEQMVSAVDLLDGDLLPEVASAAREETVHVHPAVEAALPDLDTEALRERFDGLDDTRVAVVPPPGRDTPGYEEAYADALLAPLGDDGTALLAVWTHDDFDLTPASAPEGPAPEDLAWLLPLGPGPDGLAPALHLFAGAVDGNVVADTRVALTEDHLFVHPRAGADITESERVELDAALAARDEPVRVAVLPSGARLEADPDGGAEPLADAVASGSDDPVVVYTLDGSGGVEHYPVRGDVSGGGYDLDTAVFFGLDHASARNSVDGLLSELGDASVLSADEPASGEGTPTLPWPAVVGLLLSVVLTTVGLVGVLGRRRTQAVREREQERLAAEREDAETMEELRAEEAARVAAIQGENDLGITDLGEALARAEAPATDSVEEFETHLREYEQLKGDNERANDIDRVLAVRRRTEQARERLERWNRRQRDR
ncbi:hypothetical protein [Nocardiopsis eucommiae]|uniref:hypothetical protein n=1 Tax=Nocardiopsis eucommiae TaxID=2831970 RepID=UPI003D709544